MLVLTRKPEQSLVIDGQIVVKVLEVRGNRVRLGIEAPPDVPVDRTERVTSGGCRSHDADREAVAV